MTTRATAFVSSLLLSCLAAPTLAAPVNTRNAPITDAGFDVSAHQLLATAPKATSFPTAGMVTLRDETTVHLNADGSATERLHETIKIFNQRGRRAADVEIPFNASTQEVSGVHARTIRPDGKVLLVKDGDMHESSPFSDYTMYDDAKSVGFSMPGVEDGAIVDYTYTTTTRVPVLARQYAQHWEFQDGQDPVKLSRLTISAPASLVLKAQVHNAPGMTAKENVSRDGSRKTYVWEMRNLADVEPEPLMPPPPTILAWMEVSTMPSWQTVAKWYQGLSAPRTAATPEIKALVRQITSGKTSDADKAKALFYWVEGKTRYVALELGLSAFQPHAAADVCRNRYGDCKDMATLLLTMLHEAGIKSAWPALLAAGSQQSVRDHLASLGSFNHCIVRADIGGKPLWFDSTAELCPFGAVPGGDRGADAFVIRDGVGTFETVPTGAPEDNRLRMTTNAALNADGSADCDTQMKTDGDPALGLRSSFRSVKPAQLRDGFQTMVGKFSPNATLKTYTLTPLEDRDSAMGFDCTYHAPLWATRTGSLLLINLNGQSSSERAYALPERKFPLYQAQASQVVSETVITLPAGYEMEDAPAIIHQTLPLGTYDQVYTLSDNKLMVTLTATGLAATVPAAEYPKMKAQFDALRAALNQPIVLRKAAVK